MKFYRNLSIVCLILGIAMIIGGVINDGHNYVRLDNIKWVRNITFIGNVGSGSSTDFTQDYEISNITKLSLDVSALDVNIINTEESTMRIEGIGVSDNGKISFDHDEIEIEMTAPRKFFHNNEAKLNIYLPKGHSFRDVEIDSAACDMDVEELNSDEISINCDAGDTTFNRLDSRKIELESKVSDIKLNLVGNRQDYVVDSDVNISNVNIQDNDGIIIGDRVIELEVNVGNVNVTFLGV